MQQTQDKFIKFLHLDLNNFFAKKILDLVIPKFRNGVIILFDNFTGTGGEKQLLTHKKYSRNNNKYLLQLPAY
jgi:mannose/fructose-specific phosphotransferase system component IIA